MPTIDWTWLEAINLFQVAVVITSIFIIARMLMRFWPWLRKVMALTAALAQLPDFIERTDRKLAEVHHEVHYNNGSSVKDAQARTEAAVERIELGVKGLYDRADASDRADAEIRADLEQTRPPARKRAT